MIFVSEFNRAILNASILSTKKKKKKMRNIIIITIIILINPRTPGADVHEPLRLIHNKN